VHLRHARHLSAAQAALGRVRVVVMVVHVVCIEAVVVRMRVVVSVVLVIIGAVKLSAVAPPAREAV
jgi:hypothetical protein